MAETIVKEKGKLVQEFNEVVSNAEDLLKSAAASGGEKAKAMREEIAHDLEEWRSRIAQLEEQAVRRARAAAREADVYVHANPWQAVGVAAAIGALAGMAVGILVGRSR
jgi:ElaB/YqjD/DUF883 family membrane-anchored ribosome-binding protein